MVNSRRYGTLDNSLYSSQYMITICPNIWINIDYQYIYLNMPLLWLCPVNRFLLCFIMAMNLYAVSLIGRFCNWISSISNKNGAELSSAYLLHLFDKKTCCRERVLAVIRFQENVRRIPVEAHNVPCIYFYLGYFVLIVKLQF